MEKPIVYQPNRRIHIFYDDSANTYRGLHYSEFVIGDRVYVIKRINNHHYYPITWTLGRIVIESANLLHYPAYPKTWIGKDRYIVAKFNKHGKRIDW